MEWLEADARLEQKRKSVLRRQHRERKKRQNAAEAREKEWQRIKARCLEMESEDRLSVVMMAWYDAEEERKRLEIQRQGELKLYESISKSRRRSRALGLSLSTPGIVGLQRLQLLEERIEEKERTLETAHQAKLRLDALPERRSKLKQLMSSYFSSTLRKKVERAVYHQHWDRLVPLFEPATSSSGNRTANLLDHESGNGFTPVLVAIFKRRLGVLRKLLELGASPNVETKSGVTPLLAVVMTGDFVALSILVEFKVDLNYETQHYANAVLLAADKGREEVLRALLEHGAHVDGVNTLGRSTLTQAVISGHSVLLRILLAYGASKELRDREGKAALDWAIELKYRAMVATLNGSNSNASLLNQLKAEDQEEYDSVQTSLSANRVAQRKRTTELEKTMREADLRRIREFLSAEKTQLSPNYEDARGNTPLLVLCGEGTCDDVAFGLKFNCIATHQNREGVNALMIACKRGDVAMMKLLLKSDCDLLTRDFAGRDSYHYLNDFEHPDLAIEFTKMYRSQNRASHPALLLGAVLPFADLPSPTYSISLELGRITVRSRDGEDDGSDLDVIDDENPDDPPNDELLDRATQKWGIRQCTLKRSQQRKKLYETERGHILAARMRGRRNSLIAPLSSDPAGRLKFPTCDNCQQSRARKRCFQCEQVLCDKCHARLHELAQRRHHQYEELEPELYVGHEPKTVVQTNQQNSLKYSLSQSAQCVAAMRDVLFGDDHDPQTVSLSHSIDPEVEKFQRKKRLAKEKEIIQMQLNVRVAAAKHAAQTGEDAIFTHPAELELAALYTTQKKYDKAQKLLLQVQQLVTESLGILHPTLLKVAIGKAKIAQAAVSFEETLPPDHKDMVTADSQQRYTEAVQTCRQVYSVRIRALPPAHKCVLDIREQLDEFISKRETAEMTHEDLVLLARIEREATRMEEFTHENERRLESFRTLLLDDLKGLAAFMTFARQEFVEDLDGLDSKALRALAVQTYLTYVKSRRIKVITAAQHKKIKKTITTPGKKLPRSLFDEVQAVVFDVVYKGVYARYLVATEGIGE
ncbi:hypothetical protein BBJ28_00004643 [Nothophytophthora sp. Chile5]|nr:hypothetical protein BBJ28_00004643 [Nothophytophthora sp. Chile5]